MLKGELGLAFLNFLTEVAMEDADGLFNAADSYGISWKARGGVGAFMMLARKWDRLEHRLAKQLVDENGNSDHRYDIFEHIARDGRGEGVMDDVRDLRRYLLLVEAEMRARGYCATHRDNKGAGE
jgi:hypothetical protein